MTDDFFRAESIHTLRAGAPTDHLAPRVQHEDRVVVDAVHQHPVLLFALLEQFLGRLAFGAVAHRGPGRQTGDQYPQQGSEEQNRLGLGQVAISLCNAQLPQARFFVQHFANERLKLGVPFVRAVVNSSLRSLKAQGPPQTDEHIRALDSLAGQDFKVGEMNLLHRVICRQGANGRLIPRNPRYVGPVSREIGFHASQHKSAGF